MDPVVESAIIGAIATVVSVGGTVTVAYMGFRFSRSSNQEAIKATHADVLRTLDATREGQLADRYTKAIEQLGSNTIDVAIGGIFALERIARDSPRDHPTVMEVLAACIREHSHEQWPPASSKDPGAKPPERTTRPDIQTALTVIGRRDTTHDRQPIDLTGADLAHADLTDARLADAKLDDANLFGADLIRTDLTGARLTGARLAGADLTRADLTRTGLVGADLTHADLTFADLTRADLGGADVSDANLYGANLTGMILNNVTVTGARFARATWDEDRPPPQGWVRDPSSGELKSSEDGDDADT